ncbi:MAG: NAD-dependent epimerase/dehydratase family protein [Candidatus Bathyarchaeia archaeon]
MKILITGGAGFIGSHLALYLKQEGYEVIVFDNFERSIKNAKTILNGIRIEKLDLRKDLRKLVKHAKKSVIIHAAAYISAKESINKPLEYLDNNVASTINLLKATSKIAKKIIYLSSAAVYGNPEYLPIDEEHKLNPINPYGASKLSSEYYVKAYHNLYGVDYVILRLFNVYGEWQKGEYAGVISKFINKAKKKKPLIIYGDGLQTRDFVYIEDVAKAVKLAIETSDSKGIYNIGFGKPTTINQLAEIIMKAFSIDEKPIHLPERKGDIKHSYANISKAVKLLGYKPEIDLKKGIEKIIHKE